MINIATMKFAAPIFALCICLAQADKKINRHNKLRSHGSSNKERRLGKSGKKGFQGHYFGIDKDDGSIQQMQIIENSIGLYDIYIRDASFSSCTPTGTSGLVVAENVDLPSSSFDLPLYCAPTKNELIDFTQVVVNLAGGFEELGGGTLQRPNGYTYFKMG